MHQKDYAGHYDILYKFQDELLEIISSLDNMFYLTGGTALSRFHNYNHRYSDDLDFFTNKNNMFRSELKDFLLKSNHLEFEITVESKDFVRILFSQNSLVLQLDFVHEYIEKIEKFNLIDNHKIDTLNEIMSNKFGAILNRDEPKDIADILEAHSRGYKDWRKAFEMANVKQSLSIEELLVRFETFPVKLLEKIKYVHSATREFHILNCRNILKSIVKNITL
ncbi:conserved hypothetical protein [Desulfamplus magnetovallimortis]|uniref:Nucleotidyl transferase AbiEii/AbiGii toxin family protein n=1 Tax=Desulfamplus magnetovallimortis TaxID=1246637 RepID=A0A1W1H6S4_9BACT|nr:nucleotidyl transferase AbiEii/AbiGii toxin family protein [Desulfamplus magnetovallimortis]SLM28190.1 conserved hypothetical protein [Desulfamplus magnetovallimortis]